MSLEGPQLTPTQTVIDGSWPGVTHLVPNDALSGTAQCVACEYAGCIRIVVVIVVVPKARAITAKAIVMVNFCINNQYYASYIFIPHAFLGNIIGLSLKDVKCCRLIVKGEYPNLSYLSIFVVFYPTLFILSNDLLLLGQIMCIVRPQGWPRLNRPIRFYSFRITVESPAAL